MHLKSCCLDQDIDVWGCSVASSARRGVRQQIRAQLSARGSRLFLFVAKLTGQVAPAKEQIRRTVHPPICSLALTKRLEVDNFDGSALPFGRNDVGPLPAALFLPRCVAPEPPKCMRQDHIIANSFSMMLERIMFPPVILSICVLKSLCRTHLVGKVPLATHLRNPASSVLGRR